MDIFMKWFDIWVVHFNIHLEFVSKRTNSGYTCHSDSSPLLGGKIYTRILPQTHTLYIFSRVNIIDELYSKETLKPNQSVLYVSCG